MIEQFFKLFWRSWPYASRYRDQEKFCQDLFTIIYRQFPGTHWKIEIDPKAVKYKRRMPAK